MNERTAASELVAVAKILTAMPMEFNDPSRSDKRWADKSLRAGLRVSNSDRIVYEYYLTFQDDRSNKFHYFAVYKNKLGEFVGGNAWGRIGYNPRMIEIASGQNQQYVIGLVDKKMRAKRNKGYVVTEV